MEVFWHHGSDGASLAMLTKVMGIKPPSRYAAFGSKEGLLEAALDRYAERRCEHMRYVLAGATAREVVERYLGGIVENHTDPANPPGRPLVQGGLACGEGSENIPFELASRHAQTEADLRYRFVRTSQDGDLPDEADPAALARFLFKVASGMCVLASSRADRDALREVARVSLSTFPGRGERKSAVLQRRVRAVPGAKAGAHPPRVRG